LPNIPARPIHYVHWASLAHFILWASSAHFILPHLFHSYRLLLNPFGFPSPITKSLPLGLFTFEPTSFTNSFLWASPSNFYFLSISYNSHGLTTSFFWGFLGPFAFSQATYYFGGPVDHYSCHSGPIVFILLFSFSIFFILLGFFCYWTLLSKMGINKGQQFIAVNITFENTTRPYDGQNMALQSNSNLSVYYCYGIWVIKILLSTC